MPPKDKKRKTNNEPVSKSPPVIFKSPGLTPDVRLTVFGQEFHVHFVVLKLHSNFFRNFLDSPDKPAVPATALFRYDYISVDEDGEWGLEVVSDENRNPSKNSLKDGLEEISEQSSIECLLCSMYNKSYEVLSFDHFQKIVRLADYYCALPVLSASLYAVLWNSPSFNSNILSFPKEMLKLSKKLRHPVLFRESLVHMVSEFLNTGDEFEDDKELETVVMRSYCGILEQVVRASLELTKLSIGNPSLAAELEEIANEQDFESQDDLMGTASYYRAILSASDSEESILEDVDFLEKLLKSNLVLDKSSIVAGEAHIGFLCAEVLDKDLPWDSSEIDW